MLLKNLTLEISKIGIVVDDDFLQLLSFLEEEERGGNYCCCFCVSVGNLRKGDSS